MTAEGDLKMSDFVVEPERRIPVEAECDVLVAGGGPAGVCAAIAAARLGADTILLEAEGGTGGILVSGLMPNILDARGKGGILRELLDALEREGSRGPAANCYDPERFRYHIETRLMDTGVRVFLNTRVSAAVTDKGFLRAVIAESPAGRRAWKAKVFIDATGNGDLAAYAGCSWETGEGKEHPPQAMSLCAFVYGVDPRSIPELLVRDHDAGKHALRELLEGAGVSPSYGMPTLFPLNESGCILMSTQFHGVAFDNAEQCSLAMMQARAEINRQIGALRNSGPRFASLHLGMTAPRIGIREGRRVRAMYHIAKEDLLAGRKQPDPVCRATFGIDIHGGPGSGKGYSSLGLKTRPYDIPLRALIARDIRNLLLAGRCIDGDFYAHASYRVVGNAAPIGEGAGTCAALAAADGVLPEEISYERFLSGGGNPHPSGPLA